MCQHEPTLDPCFTEGGLVVARRQSTGGVPVADHQPALGSHRLPPGLSTDGRQTLHALYALLSTIYNNTRFKKVTLV